MTTGPKCQVHYSRVPCPVGDSLLSDRVLLSYFTNHTNSQQNTCPRTSQTINRTPPIPVSTMPEALSLDLSAVKRWFNGNGMPWDTLFGLEMGCVDHLKMIEPNEIDGMFEQHPPKTQRVSRKVFKDLNSSGKCVLNKCDFELVIQQAAAPRFSESLNSLLGRFGDIGVHSKKIT